MQNLKIGIAQINGTIGDFPANAKRILAAYRACLDQGADIVITPELSLVGYPPRDLVHESLFIPKCLQALDYLAGEIASTPLLVGYIDTNESPSGSPFRNAAAWLEDGAIRHKIFKTLLPTYDIFDELRYFEPASECRAIAWKGYNIGVTICEDIWNEEFLPRPLYDRNPVAELASQNIDLLLNLSASPYHVGKPAMRRSLIENVSQQINAPVVYCNSVGANDELIFDGHSLFATPAHGIIHQLASFAEETVTISLDALPSPIAPSGNPEQIFQALVLGLKDYASKCGFHSTCLGLSGGIDSALTAVIAATALGSANVHGLTMPSAYSSSGSVDDSIALAKNLAIQCDTIPIRDTFTAVKNAMAPLFSALKEDVTEENMQARIRGILLMSLSNKFGHLLLTTGNKSELAVGYCTIYGDMCGGLALISDLPKTTVYEVCEWINREREIIPWSTIRKAPSAELRPDQKDQDTLPPYEILDEILRLLVEEQQSTDDVISAGHDETTVRWIQRRIDMNEWKRQQAAPGLRITTKAFGIGRRMPIVHRFPG